MGAHAGTSLPLVSVIIPAYNAASTLERTLQSVARQSYAHIETIIVDDGSTDETPAVAEAFCAAAPRRTLIRSRHVGVAAVRNAAIAAAQGEYVAPLDADDLWHPTKIEKQVRAALAAPEDVGFVYCWFRYIDADDRAFACGPPFEANGRAYERQFFRNFVGNGSAMLVRRSALLEVGSFDEDPGTGLLERCGDIHLQLKLASRYPIACVPEYLVGYRSIGVSHSADKEVMYRSWCAVSRAIRASRPVSLAARRWAFSERLLALAERRVWRGRPMPAFCALLAGVLLDPVRSLPWLVFRSARAVRRRILGRPPAATPAPFAEWDPAAPGPVVAAGLDSWENGLKALDRSRMNRLAARG